MSDPFNIYNWYWAVGDQSPSTQVYSTASNSFVPLADATYTAWLGRGNAATIIDTMANLYIVFNNNNLAAFRERTQTSSSSVDIAPSNPPPSTLNVTMTTSGKRVILPRMDTPNGIFIGGRIEVANTGTVNSFTANDSGGTLLATAPPGTSVVLTLLTNNTSGGTWSSRLTSTQIKVTFLSANGTFTPTSGMKYCIVECIGGGGGGGAARGLASQCYSGGGGGGGGYSRKNLTAAQVGASQPVIVGAGGGGGNMSATGIGGNGGNTSFGSLCIANGGLGGHHSANGLDYGFGGNGGNISGAVGDMVFWGNPGGSGFYANGGSTMMASGNGGGGAFGGGAIGVLGLSTGANGNSGHEWGSGGSGAGIYNAVVDSGGGLGANGVCIITEYI